MQVSPAVKRDDPRTWYPPSSTSPSSGSGSCSGDSGGSGEVDLDPWPHTRGRGADRFALHHAGWVFSDLREVLADRVFAPLFGTAELHCSKDGFTFHRPTGPTSAAAAAAAAVAAAGAAVGAAAGAGSPLAPGPTTFIPPPFVQAPRHPGTDGDLAFGQALPLAGLQGVLGAVSLLDQPAAGEGSSEGGCVDPGGFLCWPRSHRAYQGIMAARAAASASAATVPSPLTAAEADGLRRGAYGGGGGGCQGPVRVPLRQGDVILWRSDLAHCAAAPPRSSPGGSGGGSGLFQAVVHVSMAPAALTPEACNDDKLRAYQKLETVRGGGGGWGGIATQAPSVTLGGKLYPAGACLRARGWPSPGRRARGPMAKLCVRVNVVLLLLLLLLFRAL